MSNECIKKDEVMKCFKIHAVKMLVRALHAKSLYINEYINLERDNITGRSFHSRALLNESKLEQLNSDQVDELLSETASRFIDTHKLVVRVPKKLTEEGRKKQGGGGGGGGNGALIWALAIKGTFLAMAYKGIAIMSGTALLVGKMALMLSAILGLKKLVSGGSEKTTFEIVKHPKYSESYSHSSSYEDDGHYRRNYLEEPIPQSTTYRLRARK
ncbi:hypothetical protein WA026_008505 [Henosepilachna vigintioctopunctata]|uniref:Uncharacterized protein n=1 Tax=Henosepilachna vigintioctopunctata TaxID=420089 RepID=A0AAW1UIQ5_9CUCU